MPMNGTKAEFAAWVKAVAADAQTKKSREYAEAYQYLLHCFSEADANMDGEIDASEFDSMIERTAFYPRKHGYAPKEDEQFKNADERKKSRDALFKKIDSNNDGAISFNEFLKWAMDHMIEKAKGI